jgi:uncharacterized membrane protein
MLTAVLVVIAALVTLAVLLVVSAVIVAERFDRAQLYRQRSRAENSRGLLDD